MRIPITEGGKMWIEIARIARRSLNSMKLKNTVAKDFSFYTEAGLSEHEGAQKISLRPRTPLSYGELLTVSATIKEMDKEEYERFLRNVFQDDDICICVEGKV